MSTSTESSNPAEVLKTQASEAVRTVSDTINDQANAIIDTAATARYNAQDFIESNPWGAVLIAGGIGFLIGVIIARR
jgi:ElaB/YqjD/DUF883 family membrane-anchored ribosome-binding protein